MSDSQRLTKRQRSILRWIKVHIRLIGYPPTVREIQEHFNITSPNGVMCHLAALEKQGAIFRAPGVSRGIVVVGDKCPTCGAVT